MKTEKIRCEYSKEALNSLGRKQRRGYVVGEKDEMYQVLWDGNKTSSRYAKRFIVADPLIDLVPLSKEENESKYPLDLPDGRWVYIDKKSVVVCTENNQIEYPLLEIIEKIPVELLSSIL